MEPSDDYLQRVKAEILAEAAAAQERAPLPRRDPPPRGNTTSALDACGIERNRLDYHIAELTGEQYVAFVEQAYRAILKRPGDEAGRNNQINHLARGASKAEILGNMRWSAEGRQVGVRIRGLLPRYLLAKLTRIPVVGHVIDWFATLAGLPVLLRHQRSADAVAAARFGELTAAMRAIGQRLDQLDVELATAGNAVAQLEQRVFGSAQLQQQPMDARLGVVETRLADHIRSVDELRHFFYAGNHWLTTVQRNFADLERISDEQRRRIELLVAGVNESPEAISARSDRHARWSAELGARLNPGARVLDLGSGDGSWLAALAARGIEASGIESSTPLAQAAAARSLAVAAGDPLAALERCSDGSLDAITLSAAGLCGGATALLRLFDATARALARPGWLFVRIEAEPRRPDSDIAADGARWQALLAAAGLDEVSLIESGEGSLVIARCITAVARTSPSSQ